MFGFSGKLPYSAEISRGRHFSIKLSIVRPTTNLFKCLSLKNVKWVDVMFGSKIMRNAQANVLTSLDWIEV